jgi:membrane fusion protein (multidrug efflux system)
VLLAIAAYLVLPNLHSVRADALVQGDLVPVTPVYRARLTKLLVKCTSSVRAGEPVAIISNFLLQGDYQREYLEGEEQTQLASDALAQNVATAEANATALHEKYLAAQLDAQRIAADYNSYNQAYMAGAVSKVTWDSKGMELQNARAIAASALSAWTAAKLLVKQITVAQQSRVGASQDILQQAQALGQRVGNEQLTAPISGDIVDCFDRPQIVVEAGTPIFNIFSHDKAYVVAYFNPSAAAKVHVGAKADVSITGLSHDVTGRVAWIYPNLAELPPQLTRFFWEHVQFSEYRPVKILLDRLPERERALLYYNAQARVSITTSKQSGILPKWL